MCAAPLGCSYRQYSRHVLGRHDRWLLSVCIMCIQRCLLLLSVLPGVVLRPLGFLFLFVLHPRTCLCRIRITWALCRVGVAPAWQ